jgi:hypothetical protein
MLAYVLTYFANAASYNYKVFIKLAPEKGIFYGRALYLIMARHDIRQNDITAKKGFMRLVPDG